MPFLPEKIDVLVRKRIACGGRGKSLLRSLYTLIESFFDELLASDLPAIARELNKNAKFASNLKVR
jgi:hypothetical protein